MHRGDVPGGFLALSNDPEKKNPFVASSTREWRSVPLRHSDIVVDIGAYVGLFSLYCARFPVQRVTAYEPTPLSFSVLTKIKLPNMVCINSAVVEGNENKVEFFISRGIGVSNSIFLKNRKIEQINVPAVNLSKSLHGASIVKIDVEGAEYSYSPQSLINQPTLRAIFFEWHKITGDYIGMAKNMIRHIERAGFEPVISPNFSCGWSLGGSWVRPLETEGEFSPMMSGKMCCGCGKKILARKKALCEICYADWLPKHRAGFDCARLG